MIYPTLYLVVIASICPGLLASEENLLQKDAQFFLEPAVDSASYQDHCEIESEIFDHAMVIARQRNIDDLISLWKELNDEQRVQYAYKICTELMEEPLDQWGDTPYNDCYSNVGIAMLATSTDIPSLFAFLEMAVEKFRPAADTFLYIALQRFKNRVVWYDRDTKQTLLLEPEFARFIEKMARYCPLTHYLEQIIATAREQYKLKFQQNDLPKSWKMRYWSLCLSWFEPRKHLFDGEIVLDLYKFLMKENLLKKPKLDSRYAYRHFTCFYESLTGTKKIIEYQTRDISEELDDFLMDLYEDLHEKKATRSKSL